MSGWQVSKASSVFTVVPHCLHYHLSSTCHQIGGGIRFSSSITANPTVNGTCEGSRLHAPYENHPQTVPHPSPWKNCLHWNQSLVPERLGTTAIRGTGDIQGHTETVPTFRAYSLTIMIIISTRCYGIYSASITPVFFLLEPPCAYIPSCLQTHEPDWPKVPLPLIVVGMDLWANFYRNMRGSCWRAWDKLPLSPKRESQGERGSLLSRNSIVSAGDACIC